MGSRKWGIEVDIDLRKVRQRVSEMTKSVAEVESATGRITSAVSSRMGRAGGSAGAAVASLHKEIQQLRTEMKAIAKASITPAGPPRTTTRRMFQSRYGINDDYFNQPASARGPMPRPFTMGGKRYYDSNQVMATLLQAKVAFPITQKLEEIKSAIERGVVTNAPQADAGRMVKQAVDQIQKVAVAARRSGTPSGFIRNLPTRAQAFADQGRELANQIYALKASISSEQHRIARASGLNQEASYKNNVGKLNRSRTLGRQLAANLQNYPQDMAVAQLYDQLVKSGATQGGGKGRGARYGLTNTLRQPEVEAAFRKAFELNDKQWSMLLRRSNSVAKNYKGFLDPQAVLGPLQNQLKSLSETSPSAGGDAKVAKAARQRVTKIVEAVEAKAAEQIAKAPVATNDSALEALKNGREAMIARTMANAKKAMANLESKGLSDKYSRRVASAFSDRVRLINAGHYDVPANKRKVLVDELELENDRTLRGGTSRGSFRHAVRRSELAASGRTRTSSGSNAGDEPNDLSGMWTRFKGAAGRAAYWGAAGGAIYGGIGVARDGLKTMADFENAMIRVRKVTDPGALNMRELGKSAREMATEFGASLDEVGSAMEIYAAQGLKQKDILEQTRVAMVAANVTDLDMVKATEALTAAVKQFNLPMDQSMRVLDSWNEVENKTSVNAKVLTEALKHSGTVARAAGVDFDSFNGMVAAVGEATRKSGEEIGTSFKFIFQNARRDQAVEALQDINVLSVDASGKFRSMKNVLGEVADKWGSLTERQKQNVGVSIAGIRRLNDFFVLMENWDRAKEVADISNPLNSSESAMKENKIAMESLNKQIDQLKASYDGLWASLGESGAINVLKGLTNALKGLLDLTSGLNNLTGGAAGGTAGTLGAASLIAAPFVANLDVLGMLSPTPSKATRRRRAAAKSFDKQVVEGLVGEQSLGDAATGSGVPRLLAGRRFQSAMGLLGVHAAASYYDSHLRQGSPERPTARDTAVTVGSNLLESGLAASALWKGNVFQGGLLKNFRSQGMGSKLGVILLALQAAGTISGSLSDYFKGRASGPEKSPQVVKAGTLDAVQEGAEGQYVLTAKRLSEFVTEYDKALRSLVDTNRGIMETQQQIADAVVDAGSLTGEALASNGTGVRSATMKVRGLEEIDRRDIRSFGSPVGTGDASNVPTMYRELIGHAILAQKNGATVGLEGSVLGGLELNHAVTGLGSEIGKQINALFKTKGLLDVKTADSDIAQNFSEDTLKSLLKNDTIYGQINKLITDAENAKKSGNTDLSESFKTQARQIAAEAVQDEAHKVLDIPRAEAIRQLSDYRTTARESVGVLGARYQSLQTTGQVSNVQEFLSRADVKELVDGLRSRRSRVDAVRDQAAARLDELRNAPDSTKSTAGYTAELRNAEDIVKLLQGTSEAMSNSLGDLEKNVEQSAVGFQKLSSELDLVSARARNGGAFGLSGVSALDFGLKQIGEEIQKVSGDGSLTENNRDAALKRLGELKNEMELQRKLELDQREYAKKGLTQSVLTTRLLSSAGLEGNGAQQYVEAALSQYKETVQNLVGRFTESHPDASRDDRDKFLGDASQALEPLTNSLKDLIRSQDANFQKNYLLASPSDRAMADQVQAAMRQGMTADDIFSDPYVREGAKNNPLLNDLLGKAVDSQVAEQALSVQQDSRGILAQIEKNTAGLGEKYGLPTSSHASGTLHQRGTRNVDGRGRISRDGTIAELHKGEIVLNKRQSDELLMNRFETGTAPDLRMGGAKDLYRWLRTKGWSLQSVPGEGYGASNAKFPGQMPVRPEPTVLAALKRTEAQDRFFRSMGMLAAGRGAADQFSQLVAGPSAQMFRLAGGSNATNLIERMKLRASNLDILGIGSGKTKSLFASAVIRDRLLKSGASAQFLKPTFVADGKLVPGTRIHAVDPATIELSRFLASGGVNAPKGAVNRGAGVLGHEANHLLDRMWRGQVYPNDLPKQRQVIGKLWGMVSGNDDPLMKIARERFFSVASSGKKNYYGQLLSRFSKNPSQQMYSGIGQRMISEIMSHYVELAKATGKPLPEVMRQMNAAKAENWLSLSSKIQKAGSSGVPIRDYGNAKSATISKMLEALSEHPEVTGFRNAESLLAGKWRNSRYFPTFSRMIPGMASSAGNAGRSFLRYLAENGGNGGSNYGPYTPGRLSQALAGEWGRIRTSAVNSTAQWYRESDTLNLIRRGWGVGKKAASAIGSELKDMGRLSWQSATTSTAQWYRESDTLNLLRRGASKGRSIFGDWYSDLRNPELGNQAVAPFEWLSAGPKTTPVYRYGINKYLSSWGSRIASGASRAGEAMGGLREAAGIRLAPVAGRLGAFGGRLGAFGGRVAGTLREGLELGGEGLRLGGRFAGKYGNIGATVGLAAAQYFGYHLPRPIDSTLGVVAAHGLAESGTLTGLGIRSRLMSRASTALESLAVNGGRLSGAAGAGSRGLISLGRFSSGATRLGGKILEPIAVAQAGYDLSIVPSWLLHKTGAMSDGTYKRTAEAHAALGAGVGGLLGDSLSTIWSPDARTAWGLVGSKYGANLTKGDIWSQAYDGKSWYNPMGLYDVAGVTANKLLAGWADAKGQVLDEQDTNQWKFGRNVTDHLMFEKLLLGDPATRAMVEKRIDSASGNGGASDYQGSLKDRIAQLDAQINQGEKYSRSLDQTDPRVKSILASLDSARSYRESLQGRLGKYGNIKSARGKMLEQYAQTIREVSPDGYKQMMTSGARRLLGDVASAFGITADGKVIDRLAAGAAVMPSDATLVDLLNASGAGIDAGAIASMLDPSQGGIAGTQKLKGQIATAFTDGGADKLGKAGVADKLTPDQIKGIQKSLGDVTSESDSFSTLSQIAANFGPRYSAWKKSSDMLSQQASGLLGSLTIPSYDPVKAPAAIRSLIERYNRAMPELSQGYASVSAEGGDLRNAYTLAGDLFGKLPDYAQKALARRLKPGTPVTAAALLGVESFQGNDALDKLLGPGGSLTAWSAAAQNALSAYDGASTSAKALADRDAALRIERQKIELVNAKGKRVGSRDAGRLAGTGGDLLTGHALTALYGSASDHNTNVAKRRALGNAILFGIAKDQMSGNFSGGASAYIQRLDLADKGLGQSVMEYAKVSNELAAAQSRGDGISAAAMDKRRAELVLGRDYTEDFYKEAIRNINALARKEAPETAATRPSEKLGYRSGNTEYDLVGDHFVPRRHAGGLAQGETIIRTGSQPEWVMPPSMVDSFKSSVAGLHEALGKLNGRQEIMRSDAGEFMSSQSDTSSVDHSVSGEVKISADASFEALVQQLTDAIKSQLPKQAGGGGKVGDKLYRRTVG